MSSRREKIIHNLWTLSTATVMIFLLYSIGRNLLHALEIKGDISTLEDNAKRYKALIEADSTLLEELKYDDLLEKYARENYRMKRHDETLFIIEK
ncbi:MAG: septum formation initiator [Rikenellaceae bacterium]